jgi:signal transduction histidine kinase/CheY-like chemotaxis protein
VLARRIAMLTVATNALGTALAFALLSDDRNGEVALGGTIAAAALALSVRAEMRERTRAWLIVAACVVTSVTGYGYLGFLGGPAAALVLSVIVAALLLGPRATAGIVAVLGASIGLIGWAIVTRRLPAPIEADASPLNPLAWVRTVGVALLCAGVGGAMVTWVVARIEASLERVRDEEARRRAAEDARRKAEHLAVESQKLELVGRLAAGLAHDVNNHLTIIAMANGRLADGRLADEARAAASQTIVESIRSAGALAKQLLVIGRSAPRQLQQLALREVVDGFLPSVERVLPADVALEVAHGRPASVRADATQLQQALLNFVVNARDAMPRGGRLVVRTRRATTAAAVAGVRGPIPPGDWAVLEVEDSGGGISPEVRGRIFEPFFTTKPVDRGSGLGLATVAMIAAEAGGHVELESEVCRGTRIALWLPAVEAIARELAPTSTPRPLGAPLSGRVVLVVEDEPLLLDAALRVLGDAGCRVLGARDGTEAIARLDEHRGRIDLLCADVVMPGTPLRDVIARFRELHPDSPVLTCSGYVGEDLVRRGIEEGRYRLLQKPYTAEELLDAVASLLRAAPRTAARQVG